MGLFDRKSEKKKASLMSDSQKLRQKYAILNYYKKKNTQDSNKKDQKPKLMSHKNNIIIVTK